MIKIRRTTWYTGASVTALAVGYPILFGFPEFSANESAPAAAAPETQKAAAPHVETIAPAKGGLARTTSQPGSAHSFESADLYAKVSGYLQVQHVDIGSRVKRGDLLAELDVPELAKDMEAATAAWQQSKAEVTQAEARVESAIADQKAAEARIAQTEAEIDRWKAEVSLNQKQYERIRQLNGQKGIEDRIVDEKLFQLQSAQSSERAARSAVSAAQQQAAASASKVSLAKADLVVSEAKCRVAKSNMDRAEVMLAYTKILSPYDGVVTVRNFHRGAYVRSPDQGGQVPLLAVDRTDLMRVKVRIPEREVPFVQPGDKATVLFDALPHRKFSGEISRIAHAETLDTRTMLAEIDLPNTDDELRDHMYGRVELELDSIAAGVTVPSACLVGDANGGKAQLFVVEDDRVHLRQVQVGKDSGIVVEVLSGITEADRIVVRPPGGLVDGAEVLTAESASARASSQLSLKSDGNAAR